MNPIQLKGTLIQHHPILKNCFRCQRCAERKEAEHSRANVSIEICALILHFDCKDLNKNTQKLKAYSTLSEPKKVGIRGSLSEEVGICNCTSYRMGISLGISLMLARIKILCRRNGKNQKAMNDHKKMVGFFEYIEVRSVEFK